MTLGGFVTQRQLYNYSVTVRMIAVIMSVTDRLPRPEDYDNDINDGSLLMCVWKSSLRNVAPLTVSLSHLFCQQTHTHTTTHTQAWFWKVGNPGVTQNARHWGFSQREACVSSAHTCVQKVFSVCVTGQKRKDENRRVVQKTPFPSSPRVQTRL